MKFNVFKRVIRPDDYDPRNENPRIERCGQFEMMPGVILEAENGVEADRLAAEQFGIGEYWCRVITELAPLHPRPARINIYSGRSIGPSAAIGGAA